MARGRQTALTLTLSPTEQRHLAALLRQTATPAGVVRRARLLLLLAEGRTITDSARRVGIARVAVYKWVQRWREGGFAGLANKPRRGGARRGAGRPPRQQEGGGG